MLNLAQQNRVKNGLPRDPEVDKQLDIWRKAIAEMKAKGVGA